MNRLLLTPVFLLSSFSHAAEPAWPDQLDIDLQYRHSAVQLSQSPWDFRFGIGVEQEPTYQGSDRSETEPDAFAVVAYRADWGNLFLTGEGIGYSRLIGPNMGLFLNLEQEDTREVDDDERLRGLTDQDEELELEIETTYFLNQWHLGGAVALATGDKGTVWFLGGGYTWRPTDHTFIRWSLDISGSDKDNQRTDFGITAADSVTTGLPEYQPDGGLKSVGLSFSVDHQLKNQWYLQATVTYEKLLGDVADSPLVAIWGDENQVEASLGIYYRF